MTIKSSKPFLNWAGGKCWLFESGQFSLPSFKGRYFEPFLGGGAVFFKTRPKNAVLSDSNKRLIELYTVIRDESEQFEELLRKHAQNHSKDYYELRARKLTKPVARAAQFLYLNRTCWNGLYRENLKGQFNVPKGKKQTVIFPNDDFQGWAHSLIDTRLECLDFEEAIDETKDDDFIFADPPYTVAPACDWIAFKPVRKKRGELPIRLGILVEVTCHP